MSDACDITMKPDRPEMNPSSEDIKSILRDSKIVAIIGLSHKPGRASRDVGIYLRDKGYTVIPVNPKLTDWEGIKAYPSLSEVPGSVDIVDIFRRAEAIDGLVEEIVAKKPKIAWLQLGIVNNQAAAKIRSEGITVVQDRCMKLDHESLLVG